MNLTNLYEVTNKENIEVKSYNLKKVKARIINDCYCCIFLDYSKIHSYTEEKCILAEEIGHYYSDAYYSLLSDQEFVDKQEYKASKWKILHLCPLQSILSCFSKRNI